jgi:acetyl-CoA synthetase
VTVPDTAGTTRRFADPVGSAWRPRPSDLDRSRLLAFLRRAGEPDLEALHKRAIAEPEWFWRAVVDDLGIEFSEPFTRVLDTSAGREFPSWYVGGKLNLAETCVDRWADGAAGEKVAVVWENETGQSASLTYAELASDVDALARYLRSTGVGPGDRVALFMPPIPEVAIALFACAKVGAILVPSFSGYGPAALATRTRACDARVLITADGFVRKGRTIAMKEIVDEALLEVPTVEQVIVVPHTGAEPAMGDRRDCLWADALAAGRASDETGEAAPLDPNHPILITYSSGTTGLPKGIVHSHGGLLTRVGVDVGYAFDVQDDDTVLWISDPGWILGPITLVGATMFHATLVLYEGAPDQPDAGRLWDLAERHRATLVGASATAVRGMMAAGDEPVTGRDLSNVRAFASTGEPWNRASWDWLFETVGGGTRPILNYSGGTEVGGGIITCYTVLPQRPCTFSGPVIGTDADVVDADGKPVRGAHGELVIRNLVPGMTHGFWRDEERYLDTYWSQIPGVWVHGDLASLDDDGYWSIAGRSDDTMKVSGKRVGPGEVESAVSGHPSVAEVATVGIPHELKGDAIVCFVVLRDGHEGSSELAEDIRRLVGERLGRTLIPDEVWFVTALPKTRTGKVVRRAIRARHLSVPQGDLSSLEDAAALEAVPVRETT